MHTRRLGGAVIYYASDPIDFVNDSSADVLEELEWELKWLGRHEVDTMDRSQDDNHAIDAAIAHDSHSCDAAESATYSQGY
jgi:hypothetical protein